MANPSSLCRVHANVFATPSAPVQGPLVMLRGVEIPTIVGNDSRPPTFDRPLPVTFEEVQQRVLQLPRSDCEPDGFFLVTGGKGDGFWRLNGHLHEYSGKLHRVELNGECPEPTLDEVLRAFCWPNASLVFELVQEGVTLCEEAFRQWAMACESKGSGVGDDPALGGSHPVRAGSSPTPAQQPTASSATTPWHITFGTYGTRLHGDARPTVDISHNEFGAPFVAENRGRKRAANDRMSHPAVILTTPQRRFIEQTMPSICERGGWGLRTCAAAPDHVHVVCDIPVEVHGEKVRRLIKRWLTQALNEQWRLADGARWWAEQGSNKAIKDEKYLRNAIAYVERQRTLK